MIKKINFITTAGLIFLLSQQTFASMTPAQYYKTVSGCEVLSYKSSPLPASGSIVFEAQFCIRGDYNIEAGNTAGFYVSNDGHTYGVSANKFCEVKMQSRPY